MFQSIGTVPACSLSFSFWKRVLPLCSVRAHTTKGRQQTTNDSNRKPLFLSRVFFCQLLTHFLSFSGHISVVAFLNHATIHISSIIVNGGFSLAENTFTWAGKERLTVKRRPTGIIRKAAKKAAEEGERRRRRRSRSSRSKQKQPEAQQDKKKKGDDWEIWMETQWKSKAISKESGGKQLAESLKHSFLALHGWIDCVISRGGVTTARITLNSRVSTWFCLTCWTGSDSLPLWLFWGVAPHVRPIRV